jgi:hypothetical protein
MFHATLFPFLKVKHQKSDLNFKFATHGFLFETWFLVDGSC